MTDIDYSNLITSVSEFAKENIKNLPYHNIAHTENVVRAVREIGPKEGISEKEINLLEIAAWFHDTGYTSATTCENHEQYSVKICEKFLFEKLQTEDIKTITDCIMATQLPQTPRNLLEQIICDSDLSHLGQEDFYTFSEALRKEKSEMLESGKISKSQWLIMNIRFLSDHRYFTNTARELYDPAKKKYLNNIQAEAEQLMEDIEEPQPEKKKKKKKKTSPTTLEVEMLNGVPKLVKPRRDIEAMYTTLAKNQLGLSSIADSKASILLSINSIITSFAIGYLFRKIEELPQLLWPSLILAITGLVSVILAVLATRPNVKKLKKKKKDLNLLFFGDFVDLTLDEYQQQLRETTIYPEEVYEKLSRDSYFLGKVLDLKYKRLRAAFNFFMIGITLSVISFIITFSVY